MRQTKPPEWLRDFLILFLVIVSYSSLRQLHAAGQPILATVIDAVGIAAIFCFLWSIWNRRRPG